MNAIGRSQSAEDMRGGGVCRPGLTCANGVADGRKGLLIKLSLAIGGRRWLRGRPPRYSYPTRSRESWLQQKTKLFPELKHSVSWPEFVGI